MFVPNFKILGQVVPEKSLTKNFNIHNIGVRDRKKKNRKRRQEIISAPWFCFWYYIWLSSSCIQNLKTLSKKEAEKSVI